MGVLRPLDVRRRRRAEGAGLLLFGLVGLVLVAVGLFALSGAGTADRGAADGPGTDAGSDLAAALLESEATIRDAAAAARSARTGLAAAADAADSAGALTTELSVTMRALGALLRTQILGAQPFAPVAPAFEAVADRAAELSTNLATVNASVGASATDLETLADQMAALGEDIGRLRASTDDTLAAAIGGLDGLRLVATGLLLWLGVPALLSIWLGARRLVLTEPTIAEPIVPPR